MTNRMFTLLMWMLVAVVTSYGVYLNIKTIEKDTDRDNYLNANEALEYGLVDKIIKK